MADSKDWRRSGCGSVGRLSGVGCAHQAGCEAAPSTRREGPLRREQVRRQSRLDNENGGVSTKARSMDGRGRAQL